MRSTTLFVLPVLIVCSALLPSAAAVDFDSPQQYFTLATPCRVFDSRLPGFGPIFHHADPIIQVASECGIPAGASAVPATMTVTEPSGPGYLVLYAGVPVLAPPTSNINFSTGQTVAGNGIIALDDYGGIIAHAHFAVYGTLHLTIDVSGFFIANFPPVAVDDSATVDEGAAATPIDVLANDSDVESDPFFIEAARQPANGTVTLTGGSLGAYTGLSYQPDPGYCNTQVGGSDDTFTYFLTPRGAKATVFVTVNCTNVTTRR